jgi:hypothetical protein
MTCGQKLPEPETCPPSCRQYGARGCLMSDLPGSAECKRDREQA